jgi:single-stranded-DNA-specific exonuclease
MSEWIEKKSLLESVNKSAIPSMVWRFLASRVSNEDELNTLLHPQLSELKDPFKILNMDKATQRLIQAFEKQEKICIYADFDLDGTSGLAILKNGFDGFGFQNVIYYQPKRLSEGYGFHPAAVEDLQQLGVSLMITVDVGITSFAAFDKAKQLDVDVILTDHHLPISVEGVEKLPDAFCVINPNQSKCQSGLGYLSGAGVAFYLLRALKRALADRADLPPNSFDLKNVLDFFCIATLTDMVPLVGDNRVLVKHGMAALQNTERPGLKELLINLELSDRVLSSQDIAIRFAPKLNALSRMESEILPRDIYLETDTAEAKKKVKTILKNNLTRQNLQQSAVEEAELLLKDWANPDFNFVFSKNFHRGVIGLIATKIANDTQKPTFVGSFDTEDMIVGSSRLPNGSVGQLVDALSSAKNYLNRFGGHAAAAGFELPLIYVNEFITEVTKHYQKLAIVPQVLKYDYDGVIEISDLTHNSMKWYNFMGPYGVGFPVPLFRMNGLELSELKEIKGGHFKMVARDLRQNKKIDILYFSPLELRKKELIIGQTYDFLGEVQTNYFRSQESIQFLLKDFQQHAVGVSHES